MTNQTIETVELHLSSCTGLSRSMRNRIKRAGGKYSECRGYQETRYVTVPADDDLVNDLVGLETEHYQGSGMKKPKTVMIARGRNVDRPNAAWVVVHYFYHRTATEAPAAFLDRSVTECQANYDRRFRKVA